MKTGDMFVTTLGIAAVIGAVIYFATRKTSAAAPLPGEQPGEMPGEQPGEEPGEQPDPKPLPKPDPPDLGLGVPEKSELVGVLTDWNTGGTWCGAPQIAKITADYNGRIIPKPVASGPVWGWQRPHSDNDNYKPGKRFGKRLIVGIMPKKPNAPGWSGTEITQAQSLAKQVGGVFSIAIVPAPLAPVLAEFAKAKLVGYPQVSPTLGSQELNTPAQDPRAAVRDAYTSWKSVGFSRVIPMLDAGVGESRLRAMIDECHKMSIPFMIYPRQKLTFQPVCAILEG